MIVHMQLWPLRQIGNLRRKGAARIDFKYASLVLLQIVVTQDHRVHLAALCLRRRAPGLYGRPRLSMCVALHCPLELPFTGLFSDREMGLMAGCKSGVSPFVMMEPHS